MTAALLSPAIAWQQISACTDRTLTITCEDSEVISYQDLIARAAACIPPLRRLDLKRGEPVLITAHTNLEFLSCFLGLMLHGAVPVPIPPREALKTTERFMTRLGPLLRHHRVLICTPAEHDEIRAAASTDCQISRFTALAEAGDEQFGRATAQQLADPPPPTGRYAPSTTTPTSNTPLAAPQHHAEWSSPTATCCPTCAQWPWAHNSSTAMSWAAGCPCTMTWGWWAAYSPHSSTVSARYSPRHTGFCMTRWDSSDCSPAPGLPTRSCLTSLWSG
ncbi:fatty-acid-CoA ligase [Mycobacterium tuberculosis]|nr:fatty-acid-CoA ligase [Mycobacterium tuberculosis]